MNKRVKVKVIKKGERKISAMPVAAKKPHEPNHAAVLALKVTGWIAEFRLRRTKETASAVERFNA